MYRLVFSLEGLKNNCTAIRNASILYQIIIFLYRTLFSAWCLLLASAHICSATQPSLELTIEQAMEIAHKASPLTAVARLEITEAEEKINEIDGKLTSPQFELISYSGLVSDARGDALTTTDSNDDYNNLGPFFKADLKVIQPLYSFGKYDSAMAAGRKNLEMKKAVLKQSFNTLRFEVAKAFLGVVAGNDGSNIGRKLIKEYQELIEKLRKLQQNPDSDIDASHLLEAQSMFYEIERQASKPVINKDHALYYLKGLLNKAQDTTIIVHATSTPILVQTPDFLSNLLAFFHTHSPLIQSLNFGLQALDKKAELEKKKKYPDLFLALGAGYGNAPNRDKQDNAFITDYYNYRKIGGVLGLKWNFNFHSNHANERKALIKYQKILQKKTLVLIQKDAEIRKLYSDSLRYQKLLHAAAKSLKITKTWLRLESDNMDLGIGDIKRLVSAYQRYYQLKGNEIETRYQYLLSLAQLAKTAGDMDLFLQWLQNGKVRL